MCAHICTYILADAPFIEQFYVMQTLFIEDKIITIFKNALNPLNVIKFTLSNIVIFLHFDIFN